MLAEAFEKLRPGDVSVDHRFTFLGFAVNELLGVVKAETD
jgi:hypothetical protein